MLTLGLFIKRNVLGYTLGGRLNTITSRLPMVVRAPFGQPTYFFRRVVTYRTRVISDIGRDTIWVRGRATTVFRVNVVLGFTRGRRSGLRVFYF